MPLQFLGPDVTPKGVSRLGPVDVSPNNPMPVSLYAGGSPIDTSTPVPTVDANPTTIASGQQTATASAVALPAQALVNGVVLKSLSTNTGTVYVGPSGVTAATGYPLGPGEAISYAVTDRSAVFIIGSNITDIVAFTGN